MSLENLFGGENMAQYRVTMTIDGTRLDSVRKKLIEKFGEINPSVVKIETNQSRADRLGEAESSVEDSKSIVSELCEEMQSWFDSIPENLQGGSKADEVQEAIDSLQQISDDLENIDFGNVSFPSMM
jgi:hypothetical protein